MRSLVIAAMSAMLILPGCGDIKAREAKLRNSSAPVDPFPKAGGYHVTQDRGGGGSPLRSEVDRWLHVSNRAAFEKFFARDDGSNCRDRQIEIAGGQFSVSMTCDAPDGDIHNLGIQRHGSYSADSIDVSTETMLWGMPIRETSAYRLIGS